MDPQGPSHLDSLPTEIYCHILEELFSLDKTDPVLNHLPSKAHQPRYVFRTGMQPQVLRVSKKMHTLGKSVLDHSNGWIILDMDHAFLLTGWASGILEMIIVDPESAQDVPAGMMHIRVKSFARASSVANISYGMQRRYRISRQIILLPASQLQKLISVLRITELANIPRVVEGELFRNRYTNEEYRVKRREHGLSILIHVNDGYPSSVVKNCLEHFRRFNGPLNEVSIVGAVDEQQARSIEAPITLPRDKDTDSTFSEVVMHILDLLGIAETKIEEGMGACVPRLHEQARAMVINTHNNDKTSWAGWITDQTAQNFKFEMIVLSASSMNIMVHHMLTGGTWLFPTAAAARARHMSPDVDGLLQQTRLSSQLRGYIYLINGLHCVLAAKVGNSRDIHTGVVSHGQRLIMQAWTFAHSVPPENRGLFRTATDMVREMINVESGLERKEKVLAHMRSFAGQFSRAFKPVKWRVHESHIPQHLLNKGVLSKMKKESLMTIEELDKYLVVDTLVVEKGAQGDYYLI